MNWWKPKHSICSVCGVHFEPVTGYEARWGHLCATHRQPVMERDLKKDRVIAWATSNWERLAVTMETEMGAELAIQQEVNRRLSSASGILGQAAMQAEVSKGYQMAAQANPWKRD